MPPSFSDGRLAGGFAKSDGVSQGALIVLYAGDLEAMEASVKSAGAVIVKPIFSFPGGRRLHFTDPNGNQLGVWLDR